MNFNLDFNQFQQIQDQHFQDFDNVELPNDDDGEQVGNNVFSAEAIIEAGRDDIMKTLCNFTCQEFCQLYNHVGELMNRAHSGGRKSRLSPMSMFLITLTFLKSAMPLCNMSVQFGLSISYLSEIISDTVSLCSQFLANKFIFWIPIEQYVQRRLCFPNFPQCICAVDASVQEIPRPQVNQKDFYSGKHHFHCLKMQAAVGPGGLAVDISGPFPGSVHDFKIYRDLTYTRYKINSERVRIQNMYPGQSITALFDKGYIGVTNITANAVLPIRKPNGRELNDQEIQYNNQVAHDRIIVERWFGRLKRIWRIMFECFPLKIDRYKEFYMMCAALTNYHILLHPLTNVDPVDPFQYEDN